MDTLGGAASTADATNEAVAETEEHRATATTPVRVRNLDAGDFGKGYLQLLGQLTDVGEVSQAAFQKQLQLIESTGIMHVRVIEDVSSCTLVASGTLMVEPKLIHGCALVGHVEDIVVCSSVRGKGIGKLLIGALCDTARECGCYKVILDCAEDNARFYEKCGFHRKEIQMRQNLA